MMTELSLNVLDIAQNSIKAGASLVKISAVKTTADHRLVLTVSDNGCGMTKEQVACVTDPFYTTRKTRKVGLGVPFFKMAAELTGGSFRVESEPGKGTDVIAAFCYDHIDMLPIGDMPETVTAMISMNPQIDFVYSASCDGAEFMMDTREVKHILEGVPVNSEAVLSFIRDFINENQSEIEKNKS